MRKTSPEECSKCLYRQPRGCDGRAWYRRARAAQSGPAVRTAAARNVAAGAGREELAVERLDRGARVGEKRAEERWQETRVVVIGAGKGEWAPG